MTRKFVLVALLGAVAFFGWTQAATAATHKHARTTIAANHTHVLDSHVVVLHGRTAHKRANLYAFKAGRWHKLRTVHGKYKVKVRPVAGKTIYYRVGNSKNVKVRSTLTYCAGYSHVGAATWALNNSGQYQNSSLFRAVDKLICSAANNSTINIRMYYVELYNTGATGVKLRTDLWTMHKFHNVRENVLVQSNGFSHWKASVKSAPWIHYYTCSRGCETGTADSKAHSKWITVSHLTNGNGTGVLTLSANLSDQQFTNWEDGVISLNNYRLYQIVESHWNSDVNCSLQAAKHCTKTPTYQTWQTTSDAHTQVYVAPVSNDPIVEQLQALNCSQGGDIYYASLGLARYTIRKQFVRLQSEGCRLHLVLEHPYYNTPGLTWRTHIEHDKLMVVKIGSTNFVLSGSECFTPGGVNNSDNIMLRLTQPSVVNSYLGYAKKLWATSFYVPPTTPSVAKAIAANTARTDS